ncbi:BppU family phage baseplate upper protein [Anaeromassilibacillus senegalensis]|uniref:BppU family phage baseplate upper protein n=1 Tax=Anaeromassilibacillus senegalensis TaxID=1673717 RepID=UPI0006802C32|nr:BppU family phage baseplate upper protein [Anaeromassilibacillus senegalensis]
MTNEAIKLNEWEVSSDTVMAVQGEVNGRTLAITIIDRSGELDSTSNAEVIDRPLSLTGKTLQLYVGKPDGKACLLDGTIKDAANGVAEFVLSQQSTAVKGKASLEVWITDAQESTLKIIGLTLDVKASGEAEIESSNEFQTLKQATGAALEAAAAANTAAKDVQTATTAANTAAGKANTAAATANQAAADVGDAVTRANTAASNADKATRDANTATGAANTAATSANTKAQTAQSAATAANTAATAATTAAESANSAATNANSKATLANNAATAANNAASSASSAATNANSKATLANNAASAANTAASNANTKADAADAAATRANVAAEAVDGALSGEIGPAITQVINELKGAPVGLAELDIAGTVPMEQLPMLPPVVKTAGSGSAYTAQIEGIGSLAKGLMIVIIPHASSTSTSPTLNLNGLGAKTIKRRYSYTKSVTTSGQSSNWLSTNQPQVLQYDGTYGIAVGANKPYGPDINGTVGVSNGGTGKTSWTSNRLVYASSTTALTQLAPPTSGTGYLTQSASGAPSWVSPADMEVGKADYSTESGYATTASYAQSAFIVGEYTLLVSDTTPTNAPAGQITFVYES